MLIFVPFASIVLALLTERTRDERSDTYGVYERRGIYMPSPFGVRGAHASWRRPYPRWEQEALLAEAQEGHVFSSVAPSAQSFGAKR